MMRLIQAGLDKTKKEAAVKQGIQDGMQAVHSVKSWCLFCSGGEFLPQHYDCLSLLTCW